MMLICNQDSIQVIHLLRSSARVRSIHEDVKMEKLTTHTPEFLGITAGAWPDLGGSEVAGEGVVIGLIDTGINPFHPSFTTEMPLSSQGSTLIENGKFKGRCTTGEKFPLSACNGKIVGAQYFARAAVAAEEFNSTRDYASPFDADGHGRQVTPKEHKTYQSLNVISCHALNLTVIQLQQQLETTKSRS